MKIRAIVLKQELDLTSGLRGDKEDARTGEEETELESAVLPSGLTVMGIKVAYSPDEKNAC